MIRLAFIGLFALSSLLLNGVYGGNPETFASIIHVICFEGGNGRIFLNFPSLPLEIEISLATCLSFIFSGLDLPRLLRIFSRRTVFDLRRKWRKLLIFEDGSRRHVMMFVRRSWFDCDVVVIWPYFCWRERLGFWFSGEVNRNCWSDQCSPSLNGYNNLYCFTKSE